jgi:chromosome segregation ATPase
VKGRVAFPKGADMTELEKKYQETANALDVIGKEFVRVRDLNQDLHKVLKDQSNRIAELEAVLREALETHSHEDVAWTDDAVAALKEDT